MLTITQIKKREDYQWHSETLISLPDKIDDASIVWVDVENPSDAELSLLREHYEIGAQNIKDIEEFKANCLNSMIEEISDCLTCFLTFPNKEHFVADSKNEWLALVATKELIVSIHKGPSNITREIHKKIRTHGYALSPSPSTDIMLYIFFDLVLSEYFAVSDLIHDRLENLGSEAARLFQQRALRSNRTFILKIAEIRDQVFTLKRPTGSLREVVARLTRGEFTVVSGPTLPRFEAIYNKVISLIDSAESAREEIHDIGDTLVNSLSVTTNNVMRTLTIISAIFLPLTLLASVYGTNFVRGIPGINSEYGFYVMIGLMVFIASGLIIVFKQKSWL